MNPSLSISLGGNVFFIEENAYHKLKDYLEQIKNSLKNEEDSQEIISDIEYRIAELFTEYLGKSRQAVNELDIEKIIKTMGKPESFVDDTIENPTASINSVSSFKNKTLFRDYDNKLIGGVLAGIAKYFGIEVVWLRIAVALLLFISWYFTESSLIFPLSIVYIVLMIIVPYAKNASEKLKMEGKPINLDSIKEKFNLSEENKSEIAQTTQQIANKTSNALEAFFVAVGKILLVLIGIFFLLFGIFLMFSFVGVLTGVNSSFSDPFNMLGEMIYENTTLYYVSLICITFVWLIPAYFLIVLGLKILIRDFKNKILKVVNITLLIVWILALISGFGIGVLTFGQFNTEVRKSKSEIINIKSDTINLEWNEADKDSSYHVINEFEDESFNFFEINKNGIHRKLKNEIEIRESKDGNYKLEIYYESRGKNTEDAKRNIEKMQYVYKVERNTIKLNKHFYLPRTSRFRNQFVHPILYVPKGKIIKTNGIEHVYNLEKEYDDYYNRTINHFKIENEKLDCLDCYNENFNSSDEDFPKEDTEFEQKLDSINLPQDSTYSK